MRSAYHTLQPIQFLTQGMMLQVGDQLLTDSARGTFAQYRGGWLVGVAMVTSLGLQAMEGAGMIARS